MSPQSELQIRVRAFIEGLAGLSQLLAEFRQLQTTLAGVTTSSTDANAATAAMGEAADSAAVSLENQASSAQTATAANNQLNRSAQDATQAQTRQATSTAAAANAANDLADAGQNTARAQQQQTRSTQGATTATQANTQATQAATTAQNTYRDANGRLRDANGRFINGLNAQNAATSQATGLFGRLSDALSGLAQRFAGGSRGSREFTKDLEKFKSGFGELSGHIKSAVLGLTAFAGIMKLKDLAQTAARTETLGVTLTVVGRTAGYSKDQLAAYEKELVKLGITSQVAREALTKLIQAGISLTQVNAQGATAAAQLARSAQDLAVVTGENSSDTLQRLITNISQLDVVGLRYQGLVVSLEEAQNKFAQQTGKSVDQLTQQQRVQAFMNLTLEQANKLQGAYVESMDTAGKKAASLARFQQELANSLGEKLLPAYGALVDVTTEFLKNLDKITKETDKTGSASRELGSIVKSAFQSISDFTQTLFQAFANATPEVIIAAREIGKLISLIFNAGTALIRWLDQIGAVRVAFYSLGLLFAGLQDGLVGLAGIFSGLMALILLGVNDVLKKASELAAFFDKDLQQSLDKLSKGVTEYASSFAGYSKKVLNDFLAGNTATQRFLQGLDESIAKIKEFGKATDFTTAQEEIRKLAESIRENTVTSQEGAAASDLIRNKLKELGGQGKVTADQIKILEAQLTAATSKIDQDFARALSDLGISFVKVGNSTKKFAQESGDDLGKLVSGLVTLAENARTLEGQFTQAFSKGLDASKTLSDLTRISESLKEAGKNTKLIKDAGEAANLAALQFEKLFLAELKAANSASDFEKIRAELEALRKAGVISEQTLVESFARLEEAAGRFRAEVEKADVAGPLRALGTTLDELSTNISEEVRTIIGQLSQVRATAELTGNQFRRLFMDSLSSAKSIEELKLFQAELEKARRSGQLFGQEYEAAASKLAQSFDKILEAELKVANTTAEFDDLRKKVIELGNSGAISGAQVTQALRDIQEKATGARESVLRLSQQMVQLAEAETDAVTSFVAINKASLDTQEAKNDLLKAEAELRKTGTAAARAEVEAQKAVVRSYQEKETLSRLQYQQQLAQMELVRLKQIQINAERAKELEPASAVAIAAATSAKDQADRQQLVVDRTKVAVQNQLQVVAATGAAADRARTLSDNLKDAAKNANDASGAVNRIGQEAKFTGQTIAAWDTNSIASHFREMGLGIEDATSRAKAILGVGQAIVAFGEEGLAAFANVQAKINDVSQAIQLQRETAQGLVTSYERIKASSEDIARGMITIREASQDLGGALQQVSKAMEQIREDARSTAESALQAARGFLSGAQSIQQELLTAQGREDEAARLRFETRRQDLALEYELLKVKIQAAAVTARAAGLNTEASELERMLKLTGDNYKAALSALSQLESLEMEKIRKRREADQQQERERREREIADAARDVDEESRNSTRRPSLIEDVDFNGRGSGINAQVAAALQSIAQREDFGGQPGVTINNHFDNITAFGTQKELVESLSREMYKSLRGISGRSS